MGNSDSQLYQECFHKAWMSDGLNKCHRCKLIFNFFNRRHHCRNCGVLLCATCSNYECYVHPLRKVTRVCHPCYHDITNKLVELQPKLIITV